MTHQLQQKRSRETSSVRFHFAAAIFTALALFTGSLEGADYKYPYHDPYLATATTAILSDDGATERVKSTILHVPGGSPAEIACRLSEDAAM
jgi:hypothetical protein